MSNSSDPVKRDPSSASMQRSVLILVLALTLIVCLSIMLFQNPPAPDSMAAGSFRRPPDRFAELMALGRETYAETGNHQEAEAIFRDAYRLNPNSAAAVDSIGQMALLDHRFEDALQLFRRANALRPQHPGYEADLAIALLCLDRLDEANKVCEKAITRTDSPRHLFALIQACALQKQELEVEATAKLMEAYELAGDKVIAIINNNFWAQALQDSKGFKELQLQHRQPADQSTP